MQKFQSRKSLLRCPSQGDLDVWRLLPGLRPRAIVALGVHRGAFAQQKLRSRDVALNRRQVQRRLASGAFSPEARRGRCGLPAETTGRRGRGAVGGRRKWWECGALDPINRQTNDACFGLHIFKTVHIHKHIGQVSMHLFYNTTFAEMMCKDFFNEEASKDNVIPGS